MERSAAKQQPRAGGSMATAEQRYLRTELEQRRERLHEALHSPAADTSLSQLLTAVDTALSRIDQGTFGLCEECHDTIEAERQLAGTCATTINLPEWSAAITAIFSKQTAACSLCSEMFPARVLPRRCS